MPPTRRIQRGNGTSSFRFLRGGQSLQARAIPNVPRAGAHLSTPQFLAQQRAREVQRAGHSRSREAWAINEFKRLSQAPSEAMRRISKTKFNRRPPREEEMTERRQLSEEAMAEDPVLYLKDQAISRDEIEHIEDAVINQGLADGIKMAGEHSPILAKMMKDDEAFKRFANQLPNRWKNALLTFLGKPEKLRVIGLLLLLRTVCRNSPKVRRALRRQRMQQQRAA